ncbi:ferritin-like domain-containing protein [Achromobacter sp. B7]|uniref:ferritin-like domain-containing protein n=1 Tax=Achromobacter sp. B7 TaxID=2282475 RepID=UPI000E7289AE|nr:ferritin-like domain-containing protein [Achromobacter sp. B7]AYD66460.1 ferritin-like domain-containing protein [Achromobacter sp. B7]
MDKATKTGMNRTGMQMAPVQGPMQVRFALDQGPSPGGMQAAVAQRTAAIVSAGQLGSVPVPATGKGVLTTVAGKLTGRNPEVLIDKLGQRAAYERSGVRLYEAMLVKVEADRDDRNTGLRTDLIKIRDEEEAHFHMLVDIIEKLGADPTAQTPGADASAMASLGLVQVLTDPRTSISQGLEALLTAELTDHASWELLTELAEQQGHDDLAAQSREAEAAEARHTTIIRQWLREFVARDAT